MVLALANKCLRYSADYDEAEYFKSKNSFKKSVETLQLCKKEMAQELRLERDLERGHFCQSQVPDWE